MSDAFLHGDCYGCEWITQSGGHDAISISCVNPKIKGLPVKPPSHRVDIQQSLIGSQLRRQSVWRYRCSPGTVRLKIG
jgi:hypothetical protein